MPTAATQYFVAEEPLDMYRGGQLAEYRLAYETWGTRQSDNTVVIVTGLSPDAHAASNADDPNEGWWEGIVGPGKAIDTDKWFVVCVNSLGSCKGSTGPASVNPETGNHYRLTFPDLSIEDIAQSTFQLLQHLGIEQIDVLCGPSMGGMTAQALMALHPGIAKRLITISSTPAASPFAIAIRSLQREMIRLDRKWQDGQYAMDDPPVPGQRLARKLGMISYRSAGEWKDRFKRDRVSGDKTPATPFGVEFEIESYLDAAADRFVGSFDPNSYLYLSRSMDWFDIADHGGSLEAAYQRFQLGEALVIGVGSDILFPLYQQEDIARAHREAGTQVEFHALDSVQGHDSFLVDIDQFAMVIGNYLNRL